MTEMNRPDKVRQEEHHPYRQLHRRIGTDDVGQERKKCKSKHIDRLSIKDIATRHRQAQFTISPYHGRDNKKQSRPSLINWVMSPTENPSETALAQGCILKFRSPYYQLVVTILIWD